MFLGTVPLGNVHAPHRFPVITFLAEHIDDGINFRQGHGINSFLCCSLGRRSGIAVDFAIRAQVQLTIIELSIDTSDR